MSDVLDLIQKFQGLGVAGLALLFLYLTVRYLVAEKEKVERGKATALDDEKRACKERVDELSEVIDAKNAMIVDLATQLRESSQRALADMERHLNRQHDREVGRERESAQQTAALSQLTTAVAALTAEVRARR